MPAEERSLAAEEGSLSLKTWQQKIEGKDWESSSLGPSLQVSTITDVICVKTKNLLEVNLRIDA